MRRRNKLKLLGTQTLMNFYRARKKEKIFLYQIIVSISLVNIVISSPLKFNQKKKYSYRKQNISNNEFTGHTYV